MGGEERKDVIIVPIASALTATAGPLAVAAIGAPLAATVFLLHLRRSRNLKAKYKAAKATLAKLVTERDTALAERDAVFRNLLVMRDSEDERSEMIAAYASDAQSLAGKYEDLLLETGELQARLSRSQAFNQELQQTIRKERAMREARDKRIAELERKIQEQRVVIDNLYKETNGAYTARTDESRVLVQSNLPDLVTPPLPEVEKRSTGPWPTRLPRPPVPFRDISMRPSEN